MTFTYYWKTSNSDRHTGEIDAPDREAAFALLRERGIRAIKVEPKGWETGEGYKGVKKRVVTAIAVAAALCGGVIAWLAADRDGGKSTEAQGKSAGITSRIVEMVPGSRIAKPYPRRYIRSLADGLTSVTCFVHVSENYLARFAMPGVDCGNLPDEPAELVGDFCDALDHNIVITANDDSDIAELKCIVAGLKAEAELYLRTGSGIKDFFRFVRNRQKMESDCRQRMLDEVLMNGDDRAARLKAANETLSAMGLAPIELDSANP